MADTTITALTAAVTLTGAEVLPIDQAGSTVKVTTALVAALAGGIPQGGPLTEDLNFNGFAAENVGTLTAAYINGISGGASTLDGGLIATDGDGNITANSFIGEGGTISISGNFLSGLFNGTGFVDIASFILGGNTINAVSTVSSTTLVTQDGDVTSCTVDTNPLSGIYDGTGSLFCGTIGNADVGQCYVTGNQLTGLFDGSGNLNVSGLTTQSITIGANFIDVILGISGNVVTSDASASGIAAFQSDGSLAQATGVNMKPTVANTFSGTGTATTSFVVTIGSTLANTNYTPVITPRNALSSAVFNVSAKTTTTFTVTYLTGLTGTVAFDWSLIPW